MKKYLLILAVVMSSSVIGFGQFHFGAGGQLISNGTIFGVQGKTLYQINETFDASGTFTYHLGSSLDWTIDLDAHYTILEISDSFHISPLAGLSITSAVDNKVGLNVGGIIDFIAGEKEKRVYIEPKVILGGVSSFVLSGGILL